MGQRERYLERLETIEQEIKFIGEEYSLAQGEAEKFNHLYRLRHAQEYKKLGESNPTLKGTEKEKLARAIVEEEHNKLVSARADAVSNAERLKAKFSALDSRRSIGQTIVNITKEK